MNYIYHHHIYHINLFLPKAAINKTKMSYYFGDISLVNAFFRNYLKEKSWSETNLQLSSATLLQFIFPISDYPLCCWWLILPIQKKAKNLKNDWNPGKWVLIWEYSVRAFQWIPAWQGLDGFQRKLCFCAFDESSLSIVRVNETHWMKNSSLKRNCSTQ